MLNLFELAYRCLVESDLEKKIGLSNSIVERYHGNVLSLQDDTCPVVLFRPGLPENLELVPARALAKRNFSTEQGKAAMLHALTHIEFNAINIAWDAIYRFRDMPHEYYSDWVNIAHEETSHFRMLRRQLNERGYEYGDFEAHDGLWRIVEKTGVDLLTRMAIVPRVYEARGLDVSPEIIRKFEDSGEREICKAMQIIYEDEIGHVAVGNRWFRYLCHKRGLEPVGTFIDLIKRNMGSVPRIKLNHEARLAAGFSEEELAQLEAEFA